MSPYSPTSRCSIKIPCTLMDKHQKVTVTLTGSLSVLFLLLTCSRMTHQASGVFGQDVLPSIPSHTPQHLLLDCIRVSPVEVGTQPWISVMSRVPEDSPSIRNQQNDVLGFNPSKSSYSMETSPG